MLNLLLVIVNVSEVTWLGEQYRKVSAPEMSRHLHEGTGLLIISIILSMLVILYLFRKNLNFYPKNALLVRGSLVWIVQNGILGMNVALRNWFYISQYGLTYRRIGVFFFLVLVIAGLVILWIKIRGLKTTWYLVGKNAWSFYVAFLLLSVINWESLIASYNLRDSAPSVDTENLMSLPDCSLKILDQHRLQLIKADPGNKEYINNRLDKRIHYLVGRQKNLDWQSQNYNGRRVYRYFTLKIAKQ
jgi:hypothetical protein